MAHWFNHSGTTLNVPVVGRDVDDGETVEVPDDVILPANYFRLVGDQGNVQESVPAPAPAVAQGEEEQ